MKTPPISARVETRHGRPTLILNEQPHPQLLYALTDCPGGRNTWEEIPSRNIALFGQNGFRLFQCGLWLRDIVRADGTIDLTYVHRQINGVRTACPDGAVMFRLHLHPPLDWCEKNPDECVGYSGTQPATNHKIWGLERPLARDQDRPQRASFYSEKWLAWAHDGLARFCAALAATPEGDAVFSIQLAYGVYGEWHQFGFFCYDPDTGVAATNAYRRWLTANRPDTADISRIEIPDTEARAVAHAGIVRDPVKGRAVGDYYRFEHETLANTIIGFAKIVRASWPRPIVIGTFFGYFYCMFGRQAAGGHLAVDRILASPHIDALCMTPSYTPGARAMGGAGHGRGIMAAVRRAGKLCLDEMDQPTMTGNGCPWDKTFKSTYSDDAAMLRRNILQPLTRGGGAWWFDFGPLAGLNRDTFMGIGGWWDHPRLSADTARLHQLATGRFGKPFSKPADVLVIHDPWSFTEIASRPHNPAKTEFGVMPVSDVDPITPLVTDYLFESLQASGTIFDDALLSEIGTLDFTPYKLVLFATTPVLTATQREIIRTRVARDGRHVALLGYCGWSDGVASLSPQHEGDLLGCKVEAHTIPAAASEITIDGVSEKVDLKRAFELPVFSGANGSEIIGRWPDGSASAVCCKAANGEATLWAFALPPVKPATLRALARRAGCVIVNEHDEITIAGDGFLAIHTITGGDRTLRLPGNGSACEIKTTLPPRSTTIFDTATGEILMA